MAQAATTMCPGTVDDPNDREFSLTVTGPAPVCIGFGSGNISGNPSGSNPDPIFSLAAFPAGAGLLDKADDGAGPIGSVVLSATGVGNTFGTFQIFLPTGFSLTDAVLGFKIGQGNLSPDWAAFSIADGILSGSWGISGNQTLSHANLYGELVPVAAVPLPAGGLSLIGALGGLAMLRRRKNT